MISLAELRKLDNRLVVIGNHEAIIQSILDFDFLSGHDPSVNSIVTGRRGVAKYFYGRKEILIPTAVDLPSDLSNTWFLSLVSGRRTLSTVSELVERGAVGGAIFAENTPEFHSLALASLARHHSSLVIGPATVGLLVPGALKLGPIGGITPEQINFYHLTKPGSLAVLTASGGMTTELINIASAAGQRLSFALSFGGDRFPVLSPRDAFILAEEDPQTETILYYGELGGEDEYDLVKLKQDGLLTKRVIAHIAGTVSSLFPQSPQFGHAKAKADNARVTAEAKRKILQEAGFVVSSSFSDFIKLVNKLK